MGTPLTPKYIPYTYMDTLGRMPWVCLGFLAAFATKKGAVGFCRL